MADREDNWESERRADWIVAGSIAVAILICLVAFVWVFVELEPLMDDFIPGSAAPTVTPNDAIPPSSDPGV